ncbi:cyclophilin-type peptidyl-prolyl cis-trans isomerase [Chloropicon primus]|uniref:Peptidyl-prolyl cis-trans isomerase n=2 Tax=Chloropicon primus TaxID=1764295 RepID=A0A5B8MFH0_9CHLO|nr:cyclophilin-type peptidyl-prolyl cis-trans isomerase [Chloropicon primus]UPQ98394.1 cyclophilin-type peptidyl-prolyl cis-trans isomerase [Chloropicon primus]|eukprot:QDZ19186.1 cyclophilin-type peptidyl-prolyl cis-trans isomerase [Chloropicon primus]
MAVLLETSKGDVVVDLLVDEAPLACKNFLKLCKIKYYNNCLFHNVQKDFILQTGDPSGTGRGGTSLNGVLYGEQARYFADEISKERTHAKVGTVAMASAGKDLNASQFYVTAGASLDSLDGKHTIFGEVTEGLDAVARINEAFCDDTGRPWQNIRIRHTVVLDDPFEDPPGLGAHVPEGSPALARDEGDDRLEDDWAPAEEERPPEEAEKSARKAEAESRAVVLEMIGDMPDAGAKAEENIIFVCKLNPVTSEEDLEIIFSRFGKITSCDVIKDWKTGESLCYAFVGFETKAQAEQAYFKMDNVLIDDRRIHVDFYHSMYHQWRSRKKAGGAPPPPPQAPPRPGDRGGGGGPSPRRQRSRSPARREDGARDHHRHEGRRRHRHRHRRRGNGHGEERRRATRWED